MLYFDCDCFKEINDCFGYDVGDVVLIGIVLWLCMWVCEIDFVVCLGGDEFVVMLVVVFEVGSVCWIVDEILFGMVLLIELFDGCVVVIMMSVGVVLYFDYVLDVSGLLCVVDIVMYCVKCVWLGLW